MADVSHYLSERFGGELEKGIRKGTQWDCDGSLGLIIRKLMPRYFAQWTYMEVGTYNDSQKDRRDVLKAFKMGRLDVGM